MRLTMKIHSYYVEVRLLMSKRLARFYTVERQVVLMLHYS